MKTWPAVTRSSWSSLVSSLLGRLLLGCLSSSIPSLPRLPLKTGSGLWETGWFFRALIPGTAAELDGGTWLGGSAASLWEVSFWLPLVGGSLSMHCWTWLTRGLWNEVFRFSTTEGFYRITALKQLSKEQ